MIDTIYHTVATSPLPMQLFFIFGMLFIFILLCIIVVTIIDIVLDLGINPFVQLDDIAHFCLVFPVMLFFIFLRFKIQRRDKMTFYFFEFNDKFEIPIVNKLGFKTYTDYYDVEYQNMFGAKWTGCDVTTYVVRNQYPSRGPVQGTKLQRNHKLLYLLHRQSSLYFYIPFMRQY